VRREVGSSESPRPHWLHSVTLTLMAITIEQLERFVGHEYAAIPVSRIIPQPVFPLDHPRPNQVSWNKRDLLTYAIGIGAKASDQQFVYGTWKARASFNSWYLTLLSSFRTWYTFSGFRLQIHVLIAPSLDPSFAAFPTYPVVLFLKGFPLGHLPSCQRLISVSFRCRPRCH
jgi:hypothetical protein